MGGFAAKTLRRKGSFCCVFVNRAKSRRRKVLFFRLFFLLFKPNVLLETAALAPIVTKILLFFPLKSKRL
ncbi:hypothetical protein EAH81_26535 [Flavobacterium pectinovorum]|uniref:Uncharacterized protein n=1 Tax=Flavobacterium pectinovorum TaxID=29533 RepID=A0A502E244_9FLAO|nr:hypothetical protein EAH81_26535 [Flavobacterium pectinovorum]